MVGQLRVHERSGWIEVTVGVLEREGVLKALSPSITVAEGVVLSVEEKFQGHGREPHTASAGHSLSAGGAAGAYAHRTRHSGLACVDTRASMPSWSAAAGG